MDKIVNGIANGILNASPIFTLVYLAGFGFGKMGGAFCNDSYCFMTRHTFLTSFAIPFFVAVFLFFFYKGYRYGFRRVGKKIEHDT